MNLYTFLQFFSHRILRQKLVMNFVHAGLYRTIYPRPFGTKLILTISFRSRCDSFYRSVASGIPFKKNTPTFRRTFLSRTGSSWMLFLVRHSRSPAIRVQQGLKRSFFLSRKCWVARLCSNIRMETRRRKFLHGYCTDHDGIYFAGWTVRFTWMGQFFSDLLPFSPDYFITIIIIIFFFLADVVEVN